MCWASRPAIIPASTSPEPAVASQLRVGPNGEQPEQSAFLGAFTLVVCDFAPDCVNMLREREQACAYGGYCNAGSFEEIGKYETTDDIAFAYTTRMGRDGKRQAYEDMVWALINTKEFLFNH